MQETFLELFSLLLFLMLMVQAHKHANAKISINAAVIIALAALVSITIVYEVCAWGATAEEIVVRGLLPLLILGVIIVLKNKRAEGGTTKQRVLTIGYAFAVLYFYFAFVSYYVVHELARVLR